MCSSFLSPPSSLAYQKLSEALDLIAKAHAEDTPIVERLLYECIEHARQHAEEDEKNSSIILSTASTFMAHLQEAKDDDRRCPRRTLYEQAMRAWPGNPEAAFALASIVKAEARTKEDLSAVEALLRVASGEGENEEDEENAEEEETGKVDDDDQGQRIEDREDEDGGNEEAKPSTQIIAGVVAEDGSSIEGDAEEEEGQQLEKEQDKMSQHYRRQAQEALALLWLQQDGRHPCADALLRRLGFSHRLAAQVLGYALPSMSPCSLPLAATPYLRVYDDVLPLPALGVLQRLFAPSAAFWEDHGYFRREQAYFSYLLPLPPAASQTASSELDVPSPSSIARLNPPSSFSTTATTTCCLLQSTPVSPSSSFSVTATPAWPSRTAIETIIERHLLPLAKHAYPHLFFDASGPLPTLTAEWWAHCRRHAEGHQLHFDSLDEGKGYVRHPLISCVVYLSQTQGLGGPTLVTDQVMRGNGRREGGREGGREEGKEGGGRDRWWQIDHATLPRCRFACCRAQASVSLSLKVLLSVFSFLIPTCPCHPSLLITSPPPLPPLDPNRRAAGDTGLALSRESQSRLSLRRAALAWGAAGERGSASGRGGGGG